MASDKKERSKASADHGVTIGQALRAATQEFAELVGRPPNGVSGVQRTETGWRISVEVTELERVPASTSVIATYEVTVDRNGAIEGYRRLRRYHPGQAGDG
jgi:hypothetical protein